MTLNTMAITTPPLDYSFPLAAHFVLVASTPSHLELAVIRLLTACIMAVLKWSCF